MAEMQRKTALFKMGLFKPGIHSGPNPCIEQKNPHNFNASLSSSIKPLLPVQYKFTDTELSVRGS